MLFPPRVGRRGRGPASMTGTVTLFSAVPDASRRAPVAADRLVSGQPETITDNRYSSADGLTHAGEWEATTGAWRVRYDEWEYCRILFGRGRLIGDDGVIRDIGPGDAFVIEPGFSGVWEVQDRMRKAYVVRLSE